MTRNNSLPRRKHENEENVLRHIDGNKEKALKLLSR
jgi:hypothetical protein